SADEEAEEKYRQRIGVARVAPEIEAEITKDLPGADAGETIGAARQPPEAVGKFEGQKPEAERHHDQREMLYAHDQEAGDIARQRGNHSTQQQPADRLAPDIAGTEDAGRESAKP